MLAIHGPFARDPNIRSAVVQFDDFLWVLHRPAVHAEVPEDYIGAVEFQDVRGYRLRAIGASELLAVELATSWAVELAQSDYLDATTSDDPQRSSESLTSHRHFVVPDGSDYVIDVIARSANAKSHGAVNVMNLSELFLGELALTVRG